MFSIPVVNFRPESNMQLLLWLTVPLFMLFIIRRAFLSTANDRHEPPIAPSTIPIFGHVLGMLRHKGDYYKMMSKRYTSWPIFRLKVFSTNIYVVSSPELSQSLLCNTKSLSFLPFAIAFSKRVFHARKEVIDVIVENDGNNRYWNELQRDTHAALALGPASFETNTRILNGLAGYLNEIGTSGTSLKLLDWLKTAYTIVTAETLYGKVNPISEHPECIKMLWEYDEQMIGLLIGVFPILTAPKAWRANKTVPPYFIDYYNKGLDENANAFIKARARIGRQHNFTNEDIGSCDLAILHTALVNTVPNTFSLLVRIFNDPLLTAEISAEVESVATRSTINGVDHLSLDVSSINAQCPILVSAFQENIRVCVNATSTRFVTEDVLLKDQFQLKKGGLVQISGGYLHESQKYWGSDVAAFNPYRFLKTIDLTREQKKAQAQGLLPFGGGKHLCPGRHLAFVEIVAFVGLLVLGFEMRMADGGKVRIPPFKKQNLGENSKHPAFDVDVFVERKKGFEGVAFGFVVDGEKDEGEISAL